VGAKRGYRDSSIPGTARRRDGESKKLENQFELSPPVFTRAAGKNPGGMVRCGPRLTAAVVSNNEVSEWNGLSLE
jgi:hypothetical protein